MFQCAPSASKPSQSKGLLKCPSSAHRSLLNLYIQMCAVPSHHQHWETIDTIYYRSTTTRNTHPYGCSPLRLPRRAPLPTTHFRPEWTQWDTRSRDSGAILDGENMTNQRFRYVIAARCTTYEPCPPYNNHEHGGAKGMIRTITEKARAMMIASQAPVRFWGEAVNTAVYLHQRSPMEVMKTQNNSDAYQAPCKMQYEMLHQFGTPTHIADGNEISYRASLHNFPRFECYASRLIPDVQCHQGKFGPRSKPCMIVGYPHD